jgi:hypothetical protein
MPELRRTIRRLSPEESNLAAEPWWPVFLALVVFAGFASGTVLVYLRFDATDWYANAAFWLGVIGVVVAACAAAPLFISPRMLRRSLLLAIVLNLILHLVLIVAFTEVPIFGLPYFGARPSTHRSPRREARVIPDYPSMRMSAVRERERENEKPIETETPVEAKEITPEEPSAEKREVTEEPTPNIPLPSTADSAAEATSLPTTASTRRADSMAESGPAEAQSVRFSESPSLRSRREVDQSDRRIARPVDLIPEPGAAPSSPAESALTAKETDIAKTESAATPTASSRAPEDAFPKATDSPRAEMSATPSENVAASSAARQPVPSRTVDSSAAEVARSSADRPSESLSAQATALQQSDSGSMPSQLEVTSPSTGVAAASSRSQTTRAEASALPSSDTVSHSGNLRRANESAAPSITMAAPAAERLAGGAATTELTAAPTSSLAQQSGQESPSQIASQAMSNAPSGGANLQAAAEARSNRTSTAAPAETNSGDASLPRASIASNSPRSPVNADTPDVAGAGETATGEPTTPTQTSITQAQSGIAGGASGPNLDRSAPAGASPALAPSGMARRETTSQASAPGEAFESSASAVVRRSQAGAATPSTTLRADDAPFAAAEGSQRVADVNATSSAAVTQQASSESGSSNAMSSGTLEVDIGPTRIVAERGEGRGTGGGSPQINDRSFDSQSRPAFASSRSPGYVPSSIKADAAAGATSTSESATAQGQGPTAEALQASQLGGTSEQSLSSLAGREAPTSPNAAGNLATMAPGSRATGGDSPAPSNSSDEASGSPSSRRSTSTAPALAGLKAEEIGGVASADDSGEPGLAAAQVAQGAKVSESGGANVRAASGPQIEGIAAAGNLGGGSAKAASGDSPPASAISGSSPALVTKGSSSASPTIGLKADSIEIARNVPSDGTSDPGQGLAFSTNSAKGSDVTRQGTESLPVLLSAPEGAGGLGREIGVDAGIARATAMRDSTNVDDSAVRLSRSIGALAPTTVASTGVPKEAFESRGDRLAGRPQTPAGGSAGAPSPETEEAIERGLSFLASIQQRDGRWSLAMPGERTQITSDTAATALALLSFQGAGYTHREHKHKERVAAGLQFLVRNQKRSGDLYMSEDELSNESAALYSHALASIALCEAYGMTQDPLLKEPAERALQYIIKCQSAERGGWRYVPQVSSDTSVSGWMLMALKSGQLSGIEVPQSSLENVKKWLELAAARDSNGSLYVYNPYAVDAQAHGKDASLPMTSVGLLMRFYTGWNRDNPSMIAGANYLRKSPPSLQNRDTYYWYYATQVMFHMGGEYWDEWNRALHPMLIESQIKQGQLGGSWDPSFPVRDRWAAHGGRLYVTTMNLLSLEVYYRHLPLFEETAK